MVKARLSSTIFKIFAKAVPGAKGANAHWFAEDIVIDTSDIFNGGIIVIDFSYAANTIIEYTLGGNVAGPWIALNNGAPISGGQSRFIRVEDGNLLNFRAQDAGTLNRAIVGEV